MSSYYERKIDGGVLRLQVMPVRIGEEYVEPPAGYLAVREEEFTENSDGRLVRTMVFDPVWMRAEDVEAYGRLVYVGNKFRVVNGGSYGSIRLDDSRITIIKVLRIAAHPRLRLKDAKSHVDAVAGGDPGACDREFELARMDDRTSAEKSWIEAMFERGYFVRV